MKRRYKILAFILFAVLAFAILPWKIWVEDRLKNELAMRGMSGLEFNIDSVGINQIVVKNIALGELKLPDIKLDYSPLELLSGNFRGFNATSLSFKKGKLDILLSGVHLKLEPDEKNEKFSGHWNVEKIVISGLPIVLTALEANGNAGLEAGNAVIDGDVFSADKKTFANFALTYPIYKAEDAAIAIKSAKMPWNEGVVEAENVSLPIFANEPIKVNLQVKSVSLNSLLAAATSNKATATGLVSGHLPVVLGRDGSFTFKNGDLRAEKDGKIMLAPEVIPSDAEQVALLREALKDFHYSNFSLNIENQDKQLFMLLTLEGNNPDVYNGRVIKLNVRLTGDVLKLVTESMDILK